MKSILDVSRSRWFYVSVACAYVSVFVIGIKQSIVYLSLFAAGLAVSVAVVFYCVTIRSATKRTPATSTGHFQFLDIDVWEQEQRALAVDPQKLAAPTVQESFLISETLDDFIALIIQEFIQSWFGRISKDTWFPDTIRLELKDVFFQLKQRIEKIDLAKLMVSRLVPIINDHILDYIRAEERVQGKIHSNMRSIDSVDHDIDVARQYRRGKIHPAVTIAKSGQNDVSEKNYLRDKIAKVLPFLLSDAEKHNDIGTSLVREILACTVLTNIFKMLGEEDFYNLLIVKLIGDDLKRKDQVKKLRAALDEHTLKTEETTQVKKEYIITENMDIVSYNNCLENIGRITSLDELKQLRVYVSFQLLQNPSSKDTKLVPRLKEVQTLVETRIKSLEKTQELGLSKVLQNKAYLEEFSKFVKQHSQQDLLDFWLAVENIKAPLELNDDKLSLSLGFTNSDEIRTIYTKFLKKLIPISPDDVRVIEQYINLTDLIAKSKLYQIARSKLFKIQALVFVSLEHEFKEFTSTSQYRELASRASRELEDDAFVSSGVVKAVEDAFTQIMKNNTDLDATFSSRQFLAIDLKKELFGDTKLNRYSKLFDDLSDDSGDDSDSINFDSDSNHLQSSTDLSDSIELSESTELAPSTTENQQLLLLAAPGDLKLAEEIDKLDKDIHILNEQVLILDPLIKKAELTNNISEIKILRNSKASLEREVAAKELQKQQYIVQENDNSLYGKSRVSIQSYISGNEGNQDFILYIIEVQRFSNDDPMTNTAGWIIARRFSQFYKLHEYLRNRYVEVTNLKFPKRTVFKLQQKQTLDLRKVALEEYLRDLLTIPQVCNDKVFRSFLSSENFSLGKNFEKTQGPKKKTVELIANTFYHGISSRFTSKKLTTDNNEEMVENLREMERELKSFEEREVFIKPIINLLMTVFRLNTGRSWLRGRALLVILQQVLGTTIEKKIYEQLDKITTEEATLDLLLLLKNIVFPNNKFRDPPVDRSLIEKETTKEELRFLLRVFMTELLSTIFGVGNTRYAFTVVFRMLQNDFLVKHLIYEVFDELLAELFPEIK